MTAEKRIVGIRDRFWAKVAILDPNDCWNWMASIDSHGYGHISSYGRRGKLILAHRLSWELANGSSPRGLQVLHHCDNRRCVNPAHLFLGTHLDNMKDRDSKGRLPRRDGERNDNAKLTLALVGEIREQSAAGVSQRKLAKRYGVSQSQVSSIVRYESWRLDRSPKNCELA